MWRYVIGMILFIAVFKLPYDYYTILRVIVFISASYSAYSLISDNKKWGLSFAVVAIMFNPFAPIHLSKDTWMIIDLLAGSLFIYYGRFDQLKNRK